MEKKIRVICIISCFVFVGICFFIKEEKINIIECLEENLNIDFTKYVDEINGDITSDVQEESPKIKMKVNKEFEDEIIKKLDENKEIKKFDISTYNMPGYRGHEYAVEMKENDIKHIYSFFIEGKKAKTRSVEIYVTYNKEAIMYIYVFVI